MTKTTLFVGVALGAIALAPGAQAADLGARPIYKAPVMVPPAWSWSGFYVGANVGAAYARSSIGDDPSSLIALLGGNTIAANTTGVIGGLQAGYNWQFNSFVFGLEGDISVASLNGSQTLGPFVFSSRLNDLGTIRGRLGWAFDRVLVYGTGGVAFANLNDQFGNIAGPATVGPSSSVTGWTAGAGVEYAFADHWTARAEYLRVGFQNRTLTVVPGPYVFDIKDSLDIGRVGINYKF